MNKVEKAMARVKRDDRWFEYGHPNDNYIASIGVEGNSAWLSLHKGLMPPFSVKSGTLEEMVEKALDLQPDLRRWKVKR